MIKKLTFLFWNLNKKPLSEMIRNLVELQDVDIFSLKIIAIDGKMNFLKANEEIYKK